MVAQRVSVSCSRGVYQRIITDRDAKPILDFHRDFNEIKIVSTDGGKGQLWVYVCGLQAELFGDD